MQSSYTNNPRISGCSSITAKDRPRREREWPYSILPTGRASQMLASDNISLSFASACSDEQGAQRVFSILCGAYPWIRHHATSPSPKQRHDVQLSAHARSVSGMVLLLRHANRFFGSGPIVWLRTRNDVSTGPGKSSAWQAPNVEWEVQSFGRCAGLRGRWMGL